MWERVIEFEDRLRRNNLRIDVLTENTNKTWDGSEKKVQEVLWNKLNIQEDIEFDRCHCTGKWIGSRPRTSFCRFFHFKDKKKILKNTGIYIYKDFCKDIMELRKSLWEEVLNYSRQSKFVSLNYRSVVVRDNSLDVYIFCFFVFWCFSVLFLKLWLISCFKINVNTGEKANS